VRKNIVIIHDLGFSIGFLDAPPKALAIMKKIDKCKIFQLL
jgi:hypothetical protein